jgi:hypothetical protein
MLCLEPYKGELAMVPSRIAPQLPEQIYIPQKHKSNLLGLNFRPKLWTGESVSQSAHCIPGQYEEVGLMGTEIPICGTLWVILG